VERAVWQPDEDVLEQVLWRVPSEYMFKGHIPSDKKYRVRDYMSCVMATNMLKFWKCEKTHLLLIMKRQSESLREYLYIRK